MYNGTSPISAHATTLIAVVDEHMRRAMALQEPMGAMSKPLAPQGVRLERHRLIVAVIDVRTSGHGTFHDCNN